MEHGEKKKKKKNGDEFRWTPEEADDPEDPFEADPGVSYIDFLSADGPLRLVIVLDEFGDTAEKYYEIPPDGAVIWAEWHRRKLARMAFALAE